MSGDNYHTMGASPYPTEDGFSYWDELDIDPGLGADEAMAELLCAQHHGPFYWIGRGAPWLKVFRWAVGLSVDRVAQITGIAVERIKAIDGAVDLPADEELAAIAVAVRASPYFIREAQKCRKPTS
jgi:hypothetical protein